MQSAAVIPGEREEVVVSTKLREIFREGPYKILHLVEIVY